MKKLLTLTLAIMALTFVVSCGNDEETTPKFVIDETNLAELELNAYYAEIAQCCIEFRDEVAIPIEYRLQFEITDGTYEVDSEGNTTDFTSGEAGLSISIYTYNEGEVFANGDFNLWDNNGCEANNLNGLDIYAYWSNGDFEYAGFSGTVNIQRDGDKFTFEFNGMMYDYNDINEPVRVEGRGCPAPYNKVPVSGKFSTTFTKVNGLGS